MSPILITLLTHTSTTDAHEVETVWTILSVILIFIFLSYEIHKINNPFLTVKTVGHQ